VPPKLATMCISFSRTVSDKEGPTRANMPIRVKEAVAYMSSKAHSHPDQKIAEVVKRGFGNIAERRSHHNNLLGPRLTVNQ
jgi:hypothetical protein